MPLDGVRKAEGLACESLATGAQRQLRALQRLYPPLADDMLVRGIWAMFDYLRLPTCIFTGYRHYEEAYVKDASG
jgi:hypothetical protein